MKTCSSKSSLVDRKYNTIHVCVQWCAEKITRDSFSLQTKLSVDGFPDRFTHKKLWYLPPEKGIKCFGSRVWVWVSQSWQSWVSQSWGLFSMHFAPQCTYLVTCGGLFWKHTKYNIAMLYFVCFENNHSNALERNCTDQRFAFETLSTSEVIHRGIRCSFNWGMLFTSKQTTSNLLKDKFKCMNTN